MIESCAKWVPQVSHYAQDVYDVRLLAFSVFLCLANEMLGTEDIAEYVSLYECLDLLGITLKHRPGCHPCPHIIDKYRNLSMLVALSITALKLQRRGKDLPVLLKACLGEVYFKPFRTQLGWRYLLKLILQVI